MCIRDRDVNSIGVSISVIASNTADEAVIYEITKFLILPLVAAGRDSLFNVPFV